jgi:hypothetical protein
MFEGLKQRFSFYFHSVWFYPVLIILIVIGCLASLPLIIDSDAGSTWFDPSFNAEKLFSSWDEYTGLGQPALNNLTSLTLRLYYSFFSIFSSSPNFIQKAAWITFFVVSSIVLYRICYRHISSRWKSACLSLFIIFNPLAQYFLWNKQHWAYYLTVPYFIGMLWTVDLYENNNIKSGIKIAFLWLLFGFAFNQPAYIAPFFMLQAVVFIYYLIVSNSRSKTIITALKNVSLFIIVNAVYIIPLIIGGSATLNNSIATYAHADPLPILHSLQSLNFSYSLFGNSKGDGDIYLNNNASLIIMFVVILILFSWVFIKKNNDIGTRNYSLYLVFLISFLMFIFFFKGLSPPLTSVSNVIFSLKPFYIFRDFKDKFAIGVSVSISLALLFLLSGFKSKFNSALLGILVALSLILFIGRTWFPAGYKTSSQLSYFNTVKLSKGSDYRILNLPLVDYSFFHTSKPYFQANNPMLNIFHHPVIYTTQIDTYPAVANLKAQLIAGTLPSPQFKSFLNDYSVKYVLDNKNSLVREDKDPYAFNFITIQKYAFLIKVQSTKYYDLYEYNNYLPILSGNVPAETDQISYDTYAISNHQKLSLITLRDSYDPGWKIYHQSGDACTSDFCKSFDVLYDVKYLWESPTSSIHTKTQTSENNWQINAQHDKGEYVLFYYPQAFVCLAIVISLTSSLFIAVYCVILKRHHA